LLLKHFYSLSVKKSLQFLQWCLGGLDHREQRSLI